jgi:hypothetical protein
MCAQHVVRNVYVVTLATDGIAATAALAWQYSGSLNHVICLRAAVMGVYVLPKCISTTYAECAHFWEVVKHPV